MKNILEELWYGNINPQGKTFSHSEEYADALTILNHEPSFASVQKRMCVFPNIHKTIKSCNCFAKMRTSFLL